MEKRDEHIGMNEGRPTILVVDDIPETRDLLKDLLEEDGYPVEEAADGEEGLEKCTSGAIDIVIADIKMPGLDGMELTRRLKVSHPHIEVILITGYSSMESSIEALRSGAFDYITKPPDLDRLLHSIRLASDKHAWAIQQDGLIRALSETNEALRAQRERTLQVNRQLEEIATHLLPPFLVIDPDLRITYASSKFLDALEKPREAVDARKITEVFPSSSSSELLNTVRRVFRSGTEERIEIGRSAEDSYALVPLKHGTQWVENVVMVRDR